MARPVPPGPTPAGSGPVLRVDLTRWRVAGPSPGGPPRADLPAGLAPRRPGRRGPGRHRAGRPPGAHRPLGDRAARLRSEPGGQAETLEQPGVEEVVDVRDPPVAELEHLDATTARGRPPGAGLYWAKAGEPLTSQRQQARPLAADAVAEVPAAQVVAAAQPHRERRHRDARVLVQQADERRRCRSARTPARTAPAGRARPRPSSLGARRPPRCRPGATSVARARCRALLTETTVVPRSSATSAAGQQSTSRRMSTARWRGGSTCSAATKASRTVSRTTACSAGSAPSGRTSRSAIGSSHAWSRAGSRPAACSTARVRTGPSGGPGAGGCAAGRGRRWWRSGTARSGREERPSNRSAACHARTRRLLHRVVGVEGRPEHAVAVAGELAAVASRSSGPALSASCVMICLPDRRFDASTGHRHGGSRRSARSARSGRWPTLPFTLCIRLDTGSAHVGLLVPTE